MGQLGFEKVGLGLAGGGGGDIGGRSRDAFRICVFPGNQDVPLQANRLLLQDQSAHVAEPDPDVREWILTAKDPIVAKQVMETVGPFFITQTSFRATCVMMATMEKTAWTDSKKLGAQLRASFSTLSGSVEVSAELKMTSDSFAEESTATVTTAMAGTPC